MKATVSGHVAWREINGQTVVVNLNRSVIYGLNAPGALVWKALQEGTDLATAASALVPAQPAAASRAVDDFVQELGRLGLVEAQSTASLPAPQEELPFVPPQVVWQEELRSFGQGACGLMPGEGGPCEAAPSMS